MTVLERFLNVGYDDYLQDEVSECGLMALGRAMKETGFQISKAELRKVAAVGSRGWTFADIDNAAESFGFSTRGLKCSSKALMTISQPAILHWNGRHFVTYLGRSGNRLRIFDPSKGLQTLGLTEISKSYTGFALEIHNTSGLVMRPAKKSSLREVLGTWNNENSHTIKFFLLSFLAQLSAIAAPFLIQRTIYKSAPNAVGLAISVCVGFLLLSAISLVADALRVRIDQRLKCDLQWRLATRAFKSLMFLPMSWFNVRREADANSRIEALEPIRNYLANGTTLALLDFLIALVVLSVCFWLSLPLSMILLLGLLLTIAVKLTSVRLGMRLKGEAHNAVVAEQSRRIETFRLLQSTKLWSGERRKSAEWSETYLEMLKRTASLTSFEALQNSLSTFLGNVVLTALVCVGILEIQSGRMAMGTFIAFVMLRRFFSDKSSAVLTHVSNYLIANSFASRVGEILDHESEWTVKMPSCSSGRIVLKNVSFKFIGSSSSVLESTSVIVESGKFVVLSGASGAGKSTLLKLLSGLEYATGGEIFVGEVPLKLNTSVGVRRSIGAVLQDDFLSAGTILDNVVNVESEVDEEKVWRCLSLAGIKSEIEKLPMSLRSPVGERGNLFSAGQRQRILLSRALYKNPKVLLLDELTANLDSQSEAEILSNLKSLKITIVLVSHSDAAQSYADHSWVLGRGRLYLARRVE